MQRVNADSIIEYILCTMGLFYFEYEIGKDIIRIYDINRVVKMSLLITIAIYIIFTFYIIRNLKFSEFKLNPVKNLKEYFIRLITVIIISVLIAAINILSTYGLQELKTLIILSIILIVLIIALRMYYILTVNNNKFHSYPIFILIYVAYLNIISILNLVL